MNYSSGRIPLYQVDAFTNQLFGGNPAAVCILDKWLEDNLLQSIALENNLAETVFCKKEKAGYAIRWFTPEIEMDLCGHATLAAAHVLFTEYQANGKKIVFSSCSGDLTVTRDQGLYSMNFPARKAIKSDLPSTIKKGIGKPPLEILKSRDYLLVYPSEEDIRSINPNRSILDQINLDPGGIIVTAKGQTVDFVSRFFTPQASIFEDPVTGSAHCSLIPFWAERLGKDKLTALQISPRGGALFCEYKGDRVIISGEAITYLKGIFTIQARL